MTAKTAEKLGRMRIKKIGGLAKVDVNLLVKTFGKGGNEIHLHATGIDHSPVLARTTDATDKIRSRHGSEIITFAALIKKDKDGK
jgi:nucleotidyltransferase/DNA polymerase involved in DNA repair